MMEEGFFSRYTVEEDRAASIWTAVGALALLIIMSTVWAYTHAHATLVMFVVGIIMMVVIVTRLGVIAARYANKEKRERHQRSGN